LDKLYLFSKWSQMRAKVTIVTAEAMTVPERYLALEKPPLQPIAIDIPSI